MMPYAPPPDAYSLTEINNMIAPDTTLTVIRNGSHGFMDQSVPPGKNSPKGTHLKTWAELPDGKSYTIDVLNPSAPCRIGSAKNDFIDPFYLSSQLHKQLEGRQRRDAIGEKINGMDSHLVLAPPAKAWLELKFGLILKLDMEVKEGTKHLVEVKKLSFVRPSESLAVPASCLQ